MDHKAYLARMPSTERKRLQQKSDAAGLRRLFGHSTVIVLMGLLIGLKVPGWPLLMLPQGVALAFLFNLQHECTHKTPFRTEWLNEWVGRCVGLVIVQPFLWFRYFHYAHHRYTNDPKRDPELVGFSKPRTVREYVLFVLAIRYSLSKLTLLRNHALGDITDDYVPQLARTKLRTEARVMLGIYVVLCLITVMFLPVLVWVWLVPLLLGFPFLKLYHLAEHGLCPMIDNKFINTRTVHARPLVLFLTWNMPYHIEHHLLPSVPFHQLPALHLLVRQHLQQTSGSYTSFTRQYARTLSRI